MNRINIREQIYNLIFLLMAQLPLIHRITLFEKAFGFFYVGFIILLPITISRSYLLIIGFISGLLVDVFSNTPGIHASACVFIMFIRNFWLSVITDDVDEMANINIITLRGFGFISFAFPLIFIHHFIIFLVENGGFHLFGMLMSRIFLSSLFSFLIVFLVNFITGSRERRRI